MSDPYADSLKDKSYAEILYEAVYWKHKADEHLRAEQALHRAYLRLRVLIPGAFDTPHAPAPEVFWQHTEDSLRKALGSPITLRGWAMKCFTASTRNGWWPDELVADPHFLATKIALIHSEVSEMLEGLRKGKADAHLPARSAEEVEWADLFIRMMDYAGARKFDCDGSVDEKMTYNDQRLDHKIEARTTDEGKRF